MDERIAKILAKLDRQETPVKEPRALTGPPRSYEEFLDKECLEEWPQRITSEGPMDLDRDIIGSKDAILLQLKDATPVDMKFIQDIEDRLENFENRLSVYASQLIERQETPLAILGSDSKEDKGVFMTETQSSFGSKSSALKRTRKSLLDTLEENKHNTVERCFFPGYHNGELPQLPGQIEAPQLLHRVTKAQDFKPGFRTFWKKIYQSEASVAILKDAFWWHLIDRFQNTPELSKSKDRLFDRIADSFVALFNSINPEVKDKFFAAYGDCLAQSIFAVFHEAFPESERHFGDEFKEYLVNNAHEWVSGTRPPPGTWKEWKIKRLEPRKNLKEDGNQKQMAQDAINATSMTGKEMRLEVDDFIRSVHKLGDIGNTSARTPPPTGGGSSSAKDPAALCMKSVSRAVQIVSSLPGKPNIPLSVSRQANCGTPTKPPSTSHPVQIGSNMVRVMFNPKGQSPLINHYLQMKQLRERPTEPIKAIEPAAPGDMQAGAKQTFSIQPSTGRLLGRTQAIRDTRDTDMTYKQLVAEARRKQEQLSLEYKRMCEATEFDIKQIHQRRKDLYRNIDKLQSDLNGGKPVDRSSSRQKSAQYTESDVSTDSQSDTLSYKPNIVITSEALSEITEGMED